MSHPPGRPKPVLGGTSEVQADEPVPGRRQPDRAHLFAAQPRGGAPCVPLSSSGPHLQMQLQLTCQVLQKGMGTGGRVGTVRVSSFRFPVPFGARGKHFQVIVAGTEFHRQAPGRQKTKTPVWAPRALPAPARQPPKLGEAHMGPACHCYRWSLSRTVEISQSTSSGGLKAESQPGTEFHGGRGERLCCGCLRLCHQPGRDN